jgi:hypothetical protein
MRIIVVIALLFSQVFLCQQILAQENEKTAITLKVEELNRKKASIKAQEKEALKKEVISINIKLNKGEITRDVAENLKIKAAEKHALNIENKIAIIDNSIALLKRGETSTIIEERNSGYQLLLFENEGVGSIITFNDFSKIKKYDERTFSNLVIAFGYNNAIIEGETINDSPYKIGKSRFFELGIVWSTRLFQDSNIARIKYGFSFTYNSLNPIDNKYFVQDGDLTVLNEFDGNLKKSKFRMDNLVVPIHLEFGPSKKLERENYFRYSTHRMFKFGIGGYVGFNMSTRQKLKYSDGGSTQKEKIKKSYNTNNFIYGISSYIGVGDFAVYCKYDLNTIFNDPNSDQNNISLGVRIDM